MKRCLYNFKKGFVCSRKLLLLSFLSNASLLRNSDYEMNIPVGKNSPELWAFL